MKALLLVAIVALAACEDLSTAVDPVWGKQACASCSMVVSEPRFTAELVTSDGSRLFFDDLGCMAAYVAERSERPTRMWVRSAAGTWVDARTARYVRGEKSPMDYGFAVAEAGEATWPDVEAAARARAQRKELQR